LFGLWTVIRSSFSTKTQVLANLQLGEALKIRLRLVSDLPKTGD
jgi:hypothetical protein